MRKTFVKVDPDETDFAETARGMTAKIFGRGASYTDRYVTFTDSTTTPVGEDPDWIVIDMIEGQVVARYSSKEPRRWELAEKFAARMNGRE